MGYPPWLRTPPKKWYIYIYLYYIYIYIYGIPPMMSWKPPKYWRSIDIELGSYDRHRLHHSYADVQRGIKNVKKHPWVAWRKPTLLQFEIVCSPARFFDQLHERELPQTLFAEQKAWCYITWKWHSKQQENLQGQKQDRPARVVT